jgi:hypothetical protein
VRHAPDDGLRSSRIGGHPPGAKRFAATALHIIIKQLVRRARKRGRLLLIFRPTATMVKLWSAFSAKMERLLAGFTPGQALTLFTFINLLNYVDRGILPVRRFVFVLDKRRGAFPTQHATALRISRHHSASNPAARVIRA